MMIRLRRGLLKLARVDITLPLAVLAAFMIASLARPAYAMKIHTVKSPGGIEAWLVEEHSVPLMALRFAFEGGNSQDPAGKEGLANFITAMMDEGAGDLDSAAFQELQDSLAMRMSFEDGKDFLYGNFETLTANRDKATDLLRLALNKPRFDPDAVERIRRQLLANIAYAARDPEKVAAKEWQAAAFPNHPYGRPAAGTETSVATITSDDLESYRRKIFAKGSSLKIVAVGDITAAELGLLLDKVFGELAPKPELVPIPATAPAAGKQMLVEMNVPQSVAVFGFGAMLRQDPDFMAAFVINQILGGGGFASKLMEEVREKRGLAYSVYSYIQPYQRASVYSGGVASKTETIAQSIDIIRAELKNMAENGPSQTDFENAKSYLTGSYALRFDSNAKIASQLLGIMQDGFSPDYVDQRNAIIEALTLDDVKRVAKRFLKADDLIVTIVGKPMGQATKG